MMLIEKIPTYAMNAESCVFFSILDAFFLSALMGLYVEVGKEGSLGKFGSGEYLQLQLKTIQET